MAHKKIKLISKLFKDDMKITIGPKNVIFDVMIDDCGNRFKIDKKELKKLIK